LERESVSEKTRAYAAACHSLSCWQRNCFGLEQRGRPATKGSFHETQVDAPIDARVFLAFSRASPFRGRGSHAGSRSKSFGRAVRCHRRSLRECLAATAKSRSRRHWKPSRPLAQGQSTLAVAARLGVAEYVELGAIQLGIESDWLESSTGRTAGRSFVRKLLLPAWMILTWRQHAWRTPDIAGAYPWHAAFGDRRGDAGDGTCCRRRQDRTCRTEGKSKGLRFEDGDYLSDGVGSVILSHGSLQFDGRLGSRSRFLNSAWASRSYQHEFRYQ